MGYTQVFKTFFVSIIACAIAISSHAQGLADFFHFQGYLTDTSDNPITDPAASITVRIFEPSGLTCLIYEETFNTGNGNAIDVNNGDFSVPVGAGTSGAGDVTTLALAFSNKDDFCTSGTTYSPNPGDSRNIQIEVTTAIEGTTIMPVFTAGSAPTAMVAETFQGLIPGDFVQNTGSVTQGIMESLAAGSSALYLKAGDDAQFGDGVNYTNSGQIAIGTSTPIAGVELEIEDTNPVIALDASGAGTAKLSFGASNVEEASITSGAGTDELTFLTGGLPALHIGPSQNVSFNNQIRLMDGDGSHYVGFVSPDPVAANVMWTLPATDGSANQVLQTDGAGTLSWATAGGDMTKAVYDTGDNGIVDNAEALQGNVVGVAANNIVQLDGTAALPAVSGINLTNLDGADVTTTAAGHIAATTADAAITELEAEKVSTAGDTMTGQLHIDGGADEIQLRVDSHASQTAGSDIIEIRNAAGTVVGTFREDGVETASTDLTTKGYVDTAISGSGTFVEVAGDDMTGTLNIDVATATENALTLQTTDNNATNNIFEVQNAGGTVLFSIGGDGVIDSGTDIATKNYVDTNDNDTTLSVGVADQVPFTNAGATDLAYSGNLTFDGNDLHIGGGSFDNSSAGQDVYVTNNLEVDGAIFSDSHVFNSDVTSGLLYGGGTGVMHLHTAGANGMTVTAAQTKIQEDAAFGWSNNIADSSAAMGAGLFYDQTDTIVASATNASTFNVNFGANRFNLDGTTCIDTNGDRIFHDTDCDGTQDAGEEFIDNAGGGAGDMLKSVYDTGDDGVVDNAEALDGRIVGTAANNILALDGNQQLIMDNGSETEPAYAFVGAAPSGMFYGGGGDVAFTTSGVEKMRIESGGNVGIGTSGPISLLDVVNDGPVQASLRAHDDGANNGPNVSFYRTRGTEGTPIAVQDGDKIFEMRGLAYDGAGNDHVGGIRMEVDGGIGGSAARSRILFETHDGANRNEHMRINRDGNVGIGLTGPGHKLHVGGDIHVTSGNDICIDGGNCLSSAGGGGISSTGGGFAVHNLAVYNDGTGNVIASRAVTLNTNLDMNGVRDFTATRNITASGDLTIDTNTLFVDSSADEVGIGTTNPSARLHVVGASQFDGILTVAGGAPQAKLSAVTNSPSTLVFEEGAASRASIRYDSLQDELLLKTINSEPIHLLTNNTPRMAVSGTGNIGMGTTSPGRRLHSEVDDTNNAGITYPLRLTHTTSGSVGNGLGVGIEFETEVAAGRMIAATIEAEAINVASTTETSDIVFKTLDNGSLDERMRLISPGGSSILMLDKQNTGDDVGLEFYKTGTFKGRIGSYDNEAYIRIGHAGGDIINIHNTDHVGIGGGFDTTTAGQPQSELHLKGVMTFEDIGTNPTFAPDPSKGFVFYEEDAGGGQGRFMARAGDGDNALYELPRVHRQVVDFGTFGDDGLGSAAGDIPPVFSESSTASIGGNATVGDNVVCNPINNLGKIIDATWSCFISTNGTVKINIYGGSSGIVDIAGPWNWSVTVYK